MIDGELLTIGELAQRTGVARSALRYYEELDILQPNYRRSGQRRYDEAAVALVGAILLLREVGFSLNQIHQIMRPASACGSPHGATWPPASSRTSITASSRPRRLEVLSSTPSITTMMTSSIARRFWVAVTDRLQGISLQASHPH
jgi:DNA-binding transcriptional MerR regulator